MSNMTSMQVYQKNHTQFSTRGTCVHWSSTKSPTRTWIRRRFSQKDRERIRIIAVSHWLLERNCTFSFVSSIDPNPDPKHHFHMKNHHDRLCQIDLETAQNSLEFYQTTNGSVLCATTQSRLSSSHKSSTSKTDQQSSEKKMKRRNRLPRKGVDATKDKPHDIT